MKYAAFVSILFLAAACSPAQNPAPATAVPVKAVAGATPVPVEPAKAAELPPAADTVSLEELYFEARTLEVGSSESVAVAPADFDGDGHLDLVVSGEPTLNILKGDGRGGFTLLSRPPGGQQPNDFAVADLNEDGHLDIVVANHDTDHLTILRGDGTGHFGLMPKPHLKIDVHPHPHVVDAADLDGDGHVDLIIDHRDAPGVLVLRGTGDGQFEQPGTVFEVAGDPYRGFALGDLNRDSFLDIVTPNPFNVGLLLSRAQPLEYERADPLPASLPFAVAVADFNADGWLDVIAAANETSPQIHIFLGDSSGRFKEPGHSPFRFVGGGKNIEVGDFNGDGFDDAVVAAWRSEEVMVIFGGQDPDVAGLLPGVEQPWGLAAADLNGDGRDDLVIADDVQGVLTLYMSVPKDG